MIYLSKKQVRVMAQAVEHLPRKYEGPEFDLPVLNLIFFFSNFSDFRMFLEAEITK
jgi:hypothetical protein